MQEFNRDLTISVIQNFIDTLHNSEKNEEKGEKGGVKILEGLAASGLRSIRFAKELTGVEKIVANDWSRQAVESIERNAQHNNVRDLVEPHNGDAAPLQRGNVVTRGTCIDVLPLRSGILFSL